MASTALIIGASQGLGASLVRHYAQKLSPSNVFATIRESAPKSDDLFPKGVNVIPNIDVSKKDCGDKVVDGLQGRAVDHVWIVAGLLKGEVSSLHRFRGVMQHQHLGVGADQQKFGEANWDDQIAMYTICAIAPVFLVQALYVFLPFL
jgi:NAD(P)-dependent dehydrogenase (short-subunit alcohol dehydrogenase family)